MCSWLHLCRVKFHSFASACCKASPAPETAKGNPDPVVRTEVGPRSVQGPMCRIWLAAHCLLSAFICEGLSF